jgi:hypothetical protein
MRSAVRPELRPIERAAFIKGFAEKTFNNVIQAGPGAFGNAAWARIACRQGRGLAAALIAATTVSNNLEQVMLYWSTSTFTIVIFSSVTS